MSEILFKELQNLLAFCEDGLSLPKIQAELRVKFSIVATQNQIREVFMRYPRLFFQIEGKWRITS